jgi:hypothetical protein
MHGDATLIDEQRLDFRVQRIHATDVRERAFLPLSV